MHFFYEKVVWRCLSICLVSCFFGHRRVPLYRVFKKSLRYSAVHLYLRAGTFELEPSRVRARSSCSRAFAPVCGRLRPFTAPPTPNDAFLKF